MQKLIALSFVLLTGQAACGTSFTGSVGGTTFAPQTTVFASGSGVVNDNVVQVIAIASSSASTVCADFNTFVAHKGESLLLMGIGHSEASKSGAQMPTGTYATSTLVNAESFLTITDTPESASFANFFAYSSACLPMAALIAADNVSFDSDKTEAKQGSVALAAFTPGVGGTVSLTYDFTIGAQGDHVTGTHVAATYCAGLQDYVNYLLGQMGASAKSAHAYSSLPCK